MAIGIAEVIILGMLVDWLFRAIRIPGLVGLIGLGMLLGPYGLNMLDAHLWEVSPDLQLIALTVILLRAGFEMNARTLLKVGGRAAMMSCIPCLCEIAVVTLVAPTLLGVTRLEAAMLGGILAAVSPAVVVPLMIRFIDERRGTAKGIPTLVLAGASVDDAVAILFSSSFVGLYIGQTETSLAWRIASIPASVVTGVAAGLLVGAVLCVLFDRFNPRATKRVLVLLGGSIMMLHLQHAIESVVPFAALLGIMAIGIYVLEKREKAAHEISAKLGKIWIFAQLLLFTIIGSKVDASVAIPAGLGGLATLALGLAGRGLGVQVCLFRSHFSARERAFITLSYLPKATVQAAMGAVPLMAMMDAGMPTGPGMLILAVAVLSILVTAPLGAWAIAWAGEHWLEQEPAVSEDGLQAL